MKIGMLLNTWSVCGGTETYHYCLINNLKKRGIDVEVALPFQSIGQYPVPHDVLFYYGKKASIEMLQSCSNWIVWGIGHRHKLSDYLKRKKTRPNVIITNHGSSKSSWVRNYIRLESPFADKIVAVSEEGLEAVPSQFRHKSLVISGCIDRERIKPNNSPEAVRTKHNLTKNNKILLYLGRICESKRLHIAAQIINYLPDNWRFLIVGEDSQKTFNTEVLNNKRIIVCGKTENPGDYFQIADCCINPSHIEGFGLSATESIVYGVPTIAHKTGVFLTLDIGTILPFNATPQDYAHSILNASMEKALEDKNKVADMFTVDEFVDKWLSIFR